MSIHALLIFIGLKSIEKGSQWAAFFILFCDMVCSSGFNPAKIWD